MTSKASMERIYAKEQIQVPSDLPAIMKNWTKEVIIYAPADIVVFSKQYFRACADGSIDSFLAEHKAAKKGAALAVPAEISVSVTPSQQEPAAPPSQAFPTPYRRASASGPRPKTPQAGVPQDQVVGETHLGPQHGQLPRSPRGSESESDVPSPKSPQPNAASRKRLIFKQAFDHYDVDLSGTIDTGELGFLLADLGWDASKQEVAKAALVLDKDANGTVDLEEFLRWTEYAWKHQAMGAHSRKTSLSIPEQQRQKALLAEKAQAAGSGLGSLGEMVMEEEEEEGDEADY
jgi:hypothetical protein